MSIPVEFSLIARKQIALKECVGSVLNILLSTPRNENLVKDVLSRSKVKGSFKFVQNGLIFDFLDDWREERPK